VTGSSSPRQVRLIANPVAGGDASARIRQAEAYLRLQGCVVDTVLTTARGDARRAALSSRGFDLVIAAGGDGTLNEVINGLALSETPLAVLPLGTANVFALEAKIPFEVDQACDIALHGKTRKVCLGKAGETYFLLVAGVGFDARTVLGINLRLKRWLGKAAYVLSGLKVLGRRPDHLEVILDDGSPRHCQSIVICNGRLYAGSFVITPRASLTEDVLDVCLLHTPGALALLRFAARILVGLPPPPALAEIVKTKRLKVTGDHVPVQIDGDYLGMVPMTFEAVPDAISLVFPE
jgi:diacylglycerol kinase (ATP)